jgi:hypothetical protein
MGSMATSPTLAWVQHSTLAIATSQPPPPRPEPSFPSSFLNSPTFKPVDIFSQLLPLFSSMFDLQLSDCQLLATLRSMRRFRPTSSSGRQSKLFFRLEIQKYDFCRLAHDYHDIINRFE